ncbi:LacI family DNA-binding transcriptional regulator [Vibrio sp. J1-1]|uniref:LacI family DNA-binding transcriptional regulator n=1 Tax=Vibrio sp. J1-1 TaxID=2912251 RepID=UPI001F01C43B|nr:LacI family DNA-binding transcriptional regulator [Vibrio sp. J1-1]
MKKKKLKLADIAELAGVSKSTVSFVLNGHAKKHRINEETEKRVQAVVNEHNYAPSLYARALKANRTYTLGLVIPDLANMGFATTAKLLEKLARSHGYQLLIASSEDNPEQEKAAVKSLLERQVDLLMVATAMTDDAFYLEITQQTPVILFDRIFESTSLTTIKTDAFSATQQVVEILCQQARECAYLGGQLELSPSKDRFSGYQAALLASGVESDTKLVKHKDYQPESGYAMLQEIHQDIGRIPTRIFVASYSILEGVLRYMSEHQLLNANVKIATFDNSPILDCLPIHIDSIEQDCDLIATTLFEQAAALIDSPDRKAEHLILPAKLHYR